MTLAEAWNIYVNTREDTRRRYDNWLRYLDIRDGKPLGYYKSKSKSRWIFEDEEDSKELH